MEFDDDSRLIGEITETTTVDHTHPSRFLRSFHSLTLREALFWFAIFGALTF